jgi:signal transduction histidine kinase
MPEHLEKALAESSPGFERVERAGRWSLIAIVVGGILATLPNIGGPWYAPARVAVVILGAIYLAVFIFMGDLVERARGRLVPAGYVILQLVLAGTMFAVLAYEGTFGMTWLALMPLVGHAVFLLRPVGVFATCAAVVGLVTAHAVYVAGPRMYLQAGAGVLLATIFVVLFSNVSRMELIARTRSEALREELEEAHGRLAAYSVQASELAATRERNRMAREIHDSLGHHLTVVSVQLEAAELVLDRDPEDARRRIVRARELARDGLAEVRRSVAALRTSPLDGRTLPDAVRALLDGDEPPPATLRVAGEPRELPEAAALTLDRAAQEGLTNTRRHARARRVELELDYRPRDSVRLTVSDDGRGADETAPESGGFGLLGLRERVQLVEGRFETTSSPDEGFVLRVEVPG